MCWWEESGPVLALNILTHGLCSLSTVLENMVQSQNLKDGLSGFFWKYLAQGRGSERKAFNTWTVMTIQVLPQPEWIEMDRDKDGKIRGVPWEYLNYNLQSNKIVSINFIFQPRGPFCTHTFSWDIRSKSCQEMPLWTSVKYSFHCLTLLN